MGGLRVSRRARLKLAYDCPWEGHLFGDGVIVRNSAAPNVLGRQCVKCRCLVYEVMEMSQVVGPDGVPLPKA
jgi:hypothetical protein